MKCFEQKIAAAMEKVLVNGIAVRIRQTGKAGIAGDNGGQGHGFDIGARKSRNRQSAGDDHHIESIAGKRRGNTADAGEMPDAEKMLDIDEDTGGGHCVLRHSVSNRLVNCRILEL